MERNKREEDAPVAQTDEDSLDGAIDHRRLARLVARSEPDEGASTPAPSISVPRLPVGRPRKSARRLPLAIALFGLVILVVTIAAIFYTRATLPSAGRAPQEKRVSNSPNQGSNNVSDSGAKSELLAVPAGTFQMGRAGGPLQEAPPHTVTVAAFAMDNTEVTNSEYADFVSETNHTTPSHWGGTRPVKGQEQWPVVNVSLEDANAFAAWRSKRHGVNYRLPTEEEWEYAARGGDQGNLYPWGNSWVEGRAATKDAALRALKPVGSYPEGKARWGHLDMIGNVWEWTSSKSSYYPGNTFTVKEDERNHSIIRGGSIETDPHGPRAITNTWRDWIAPSIKNDLLGFRLVRVSTQ